MRTPLTMRDATRAAMRLFGWLLADDMTKVPPDAEWLADARAALVLIDKLDVAGGEELDRELERLARAPGAVWLRLAEEGLFDGADTVANVLFHFGEGGYSGAPFVQLLLKALDAADARNREATALGHPELVGLWRACTEVEDGRKRHIAVLDRR